MTREQEPAAAHVGADIGGTFTDLVWLQPDGRFHARKVLSTPRDFGAAVLTGFAHLVAVSGTDPRAVARIVHGTTVATNAIIEQRGARVALVTTRGFRDILEIGRIRTPRLYDLLWEKPPPLVPRSLRLEVDERISAGGEVVKELSAEQVREITDRLRSANPEAIAICLINAYANPEHESQLGKALAARFPNVPISLSSEVLPEIREYERTSTTVANSYLRPMVGRYLSGLEQGLAEQGLESPLLIMQSNGGAMGAREAAQLPIHIVESGPAGGVIACAAWARALGIRDVVTLDMGGTTAKASLILDGRLSYSDEIELRPGMNSPSRLIKGGGYVIRTPAIDLAEVGAGGGSLAWLDRAGALQVGPRSAGAEPGPVCYGLGGEEPTVTDANVAMGMIAAESFAGGEIHIDGDAAARSLEERIARPLGMPLDRAAHGVHIVANARMIRAVRHVTTERGQDPRDLTLFAFGGSGPVHAALMGKALGLRRVVIPPLPGLFSALGLLFARRTQHYVQTHLQPLQDLTTSELRTLVQRLADRAAKDLGAEGHGPNRPMLSGTMGLRYRGQRTEIAVPLPAGLAIDQATLSELARRFHLEHELLYGHKDESLAMEVVNLRLQAVVTEEEKELDLLQAWARGPGNSEGPQISGARHVYFGPERGHVRTPVLSRAALGQGTRQGPLIIEDYGSTTLVPPGTRVRLASLSSIVIDLSPEEG